jgi:hypothetical protein
MVLWGGSEELQRNIVGITEGQSRTVIRIDDASVCNPEFFKPEFPCFKLTPTAAVKRQVVQTDATLVECNPVSRIRKLMKSNQSLTSNEPDGSAKWTGDSSMNISAPKSPSYQATLRLRSLTVRVTCVIVGSRAWNPPSGASWLLTVTQRDATQRD